MIDRMRLAWCTDVHLDHLRAPAIDSFCQALTASSPDAIAITGDISIATMLEPHLTMLAERLSRPIYFVLGNHDFYRGSIPRVRAAVTALCASNRALSWMGGVDVVSLSATTAMVGHDGWADARVGDWIGSRIFLNDYVLIEELLTEDKAQLRVRLEALGDEAAAHLRRVLPQALDRHEHVVVLTHPPPFREACTFQGKISSDDWLPHLCCHAVGDALLEAMAARPHRRMTVLCGHTHGEGAVDVLPNLKVLTGGAEYGAPRLQRAFDLS